jgi:hypothetical protein
METIDREALSARLSPEQLVRGAGGVSYRAQQLALVTMVGREQPLPTPLRNARIESVLVHARALAWFFLPPTNADDDNLRAAHYSAQIPLPGPSLTEVYQRIKQAASKQLAHELVGAKGREPHPGQWPLPEIAVILTRSLVGFVEALADESPERAGWFCPRPSETYNALITTNPLVPPTPFSEHQRVRHLTKKAQAFLAEDTPVPATEAVGHARQHTERVDDGSWYRERWTRRAVDVTRLRTAHTDFRKLPITKGELMADILSRNQGKIDLGDFPEADRIKARANELPAVMIERDDAGELFVADGQCRVLSALWHHIETVDAYIYHRRGLRDLPS